METRVRAPSIPLKEALVYLLLGLAFLICETTVWTWLDPGHFRPNLLLILIVYLGIAVPLAAGLILSLCFGFLTDAASGGPAGLFTIIYLSIFALAVLIRQKLDPAAALYQMLIIFLFALLAEIMAWSILSLYGWPLDVILASSSTLFLAAQAISVLVTALVSPIFFRFFELIKFTYEQQAGEEV
ncbi:MAG: rod shape-determining protein MreD [Deltaproteobacteria bacterium]|nr:rod shape-determining protein MreD [Deltaproteobacteria bacterium]